MSSVISGTQHFIIPKRIVWTTVLVRGAVHVVDIARYRLMEHCRAPSRVPAHVQSFAQVGLGTFMGMYLSEHIRAQQAEYVLAARSLLPQTHTLSPAAPAPPPHAIVFLSH